MVLKVYSDQQLEATMYEQIQDIMKKSKCPNESFTNTFGGSYHHMVEQGDVTHIYFTAAPPNSRYVYETQI